MNNGTIIRTILVIATCLNTALMATDVAQFHNETINLVYRIASVVLNFVIVACATYYNNDFTVEGATGTKITREMKELRDHVPMTAEEPEDSHIEEESEVQNGEE
jgi:SPP1 family holin